MINRPDDDNEMNLHLHEALPGPRRGAATTGHSEVQRTVHAYPRNRVADPDT